MFELELLEKGVYATKAQVLIIDNDIEVSKQIKYSLQDENTHVYYALSVKEALSLFANHTYTLIIMDIAHSEKGFHVAVQIGTRKKKEGTGMHVFGWSYLLLVYQPKKENSVMPKRTKTSETLDVLIEQSQSSIAKLEERLKQERFKLRDYTQQKYIMEMKQLESAMQDKGLTVAEMIELIRSRVEE